MAHGYSQGVSRISTWRSGQLQKYAHHLLHLLFIGITIPYNSLFYHPWRIVMHLQTIMQGCQNCHASGMPQFESCTRVCRDKNILNSSHIRFVGFNNLAQTVKYNFKPVRKRVFITKPNNPAGHIVQAVSIFRYYSVAGGT